MNHLLDVVVVVAVVADVLSFAVAVAKAIDDSGNWRDGLSLDPVTAARSCAVIDTTP